MEEFLSVLPKQHLEPLWSQMNVMVPPSPKPTAVPHMWRYGDALPHLQNAGKLVPAEQAERRVLMLVNPSQKSPHTTDTLYGGLQLVKPGEIAPAHRHVAFAARFIIDGNGFTAVEGKKMPLHRGDVVVTPPWHWHDHGNESEEPVIWLDVLNLPLFCYTPTHFAEGYSESRYPSEHCDPSPWRHPWPPVQEALDAQDSPRAVYKYTDASGQELGTTIGAQAERIAPGHATGVLQDVRSFIYHVYSGRGKTTVEDPSGNVKVFDWEDKDSFAVPAWSKVEHINSSQSHAYLVSFHDGPLIGHLGLGKLEN